jgi:hypothetical protein
MANLAERFRRFRFVRKRSSPVLKIVLLVTILLSTVVLIALGIFIKGEQAKADAWRDQAALEQQKNQELNNKLDNLGSLESVQQIAQELLGLINGNGIFFQPES